MTDRERIIKIIEKNGTYTGRSFSLDFYVIQSDDLADAIIAANIGDVTAWKERAEKAERRLEKLKKTDGDLTIEDEINILENIVEEAKHRSFVFERELVKYKTALATVCEEVLHARYPVEYVTESVVEDFIQLTLKDAEREIEEEEEE